MTKLQLIVLLGGISLFLLLYFGFDKKTPAQRSLEKSRTLSMSTIQVDNILRAAKAEISAAQQDEVRFYEQSISEEDDSTNLETFESLSRTWYDFGYPAIAGHYAKKIAEQINTEESWSITGSTFSICLQNNDTENVKDFCFSNAVSAFENAISLNPENLTYQINLATLYAEFPVETNPMKGIQMLLELNKNNPENVQVLNNLAMFGMRTGQFEKALERINTALQIEPTNKRTNCLAYEIYSRLDNVEKADIHKTICDN